VKFAKAYCEIRLNAPGEPGQLMNICVVREFGPEVAKET
jgi:hypothetical protein